MKLKSWHFYAIITLVIVSILFIVAFKVEALPSASKISAAYNKKTNSSAPSKLFKLFSCKRKTVFDCTVKYLHYLRYLPISRADAYRYEFSFPVPKVLQSVADSYAWNSYNPFILGAVAQYLEASGELHTGEYAKPKIDSALLSKLEKAAKRKEFDLNPWKWILVKQAPKGESVKLYENGRKVFSSPANTGKFATTPDGTWYVYYRVYITAMRGLSPSKISQKAYESLKIKDPHKVGYLDGHPIKWVTYYVPGIKYVDYFNYFSGGIALHYMFRHSYGFPQSAGCVELPLRDAKFLYKNIGYGTIVTVSGIVKHSVTKKQNNTNAVSDSYTQAGYSTRSTKNGPK